MQYWVYWPAALLWWTYWTVKKPDRVSDLHAVTIVALSLASLAGYLPEVPRHIYRSEEGARTERAAFWGGVFTIPEGISVVQAGTACTSSASAWGLGIMVTTMHFRRKNSTLTSMSCAT